MNIEQKNSFIEKIKEYFKSKRDIELSQQKCEWYWQTLCDYEIEDIGRALRFHDRDSKRGGFPPKPSDIISKIERQPTVEGAKCQFSKKDEHAEQCKNISDINYGREGYRPDPCPKDWPGDIFFDEFEKIFWVGRQLICCDHFEYIFSGKWRKRQNLTQSLRSD